MPLSCQHGDRAEMLLLGEMITASAAAQIGLVNRVVDDEALDAES
jgi:enoyl-CoA hydratase/carnithine racemase